ncbi:golgin subfamily A member 6-like protein 22, partial [Mercenaria mercenaria]|uniref:golgin subfamily A member 6-like protein 22 n=1 Tax=Mercenaria mercenaria TaxID=6596 RepID=UPI00234E3773
DEMDKLWNDAKEHNGKLIIEYCHTQLKESYAEVIGEKRQNGDYLVPGGYEDYKYDIENTKRKYKTKMEETEEYIVTQTLNKFIADEADYESEVMINDKKLTEEDRKTEIEMIQRDNQEALLKQQMLFNDMMAAEKQQIQEHYRIMEADRKAYMEREDQKMNLIMKQWQEEKELNQLQIQMMMNENEKQRNEFKKETKQLHDEMRAKEKENRERYDRLIAQEREFSKLQIDKMNDSMRNMLAISEKREMENMKFMKSVQTSLKDFQKKQVEERRIAENLRREKERFDDLRHQDKLKFEADLQQGRMESNAQRAEIQRLRRQMNNQSSCNVC